jgi:membrane associated rhomboid family serine protease
VILDSKDASLARCALLGGRPDVVLEVEGFHHPRSHRSRKTTFTRYADVIHVTATDRALWLATRRTVVVLPRDVFANERGPEQLVGALVDRIARLATGPSQLAHMARLDQRGRQVPRTPATRALLLLCIVCWLAVQLVSVDFQIAGFFTLDLFLEGDWWRIVTANLLHDAVLPFHLILNMLGLWILGRMAERSLGSVRTICVMVASGLGAMLACAIVSAGDVVGASGVVLGLAAAVVWVEFARAEELPAWWRFPRSVRWTLLFALGIDLSIGFVVPMISGEAHVGGFLAGLLAAAAVTPRGSIGTEPPGWIRSVAAFASAFVLVAVGTAAWEVRGGDYIVKNADRLMEGSEISPGVLNNVAWMIATDDRASREELRNALRLAERAVEATDAEEPTILDTLAEVEFQLGNAALAVEIIDRAIAIDPGEVYYREQRRRFTGERAPDDRPPDPQLDWWDRDEPPPLPPDSEGMSA